MSPNACSHVDARARRHRSSLFALVRHHSVTASRSGPVRCSRTAMSSLYRCLFLCDEERRVSDKTTYLTIHRQGVNQVAHDPHGLQAR
jgi:hypothetical protein